MTHDIKGPALNERVWRLFEKAGFQTEPGSHSPDEHIVVVAKKNRPIDLYATVPDLKVKIVGSNKSGSIKGWSKELHDLRAVANTAKANAALLLSLVKGSKMMTALKLQISTSQFGTNSNWNTLRPWPTQLGSTPSMK